MTSLHELYRSSAHRFIQSVVVVDDRAALAPEESEEVPDVIADPRVRIVVTGPESGSELESDQVLEDQALEEDVHAAEEGEAEVNRLDAGAVIDRFAELGIVCAALRPVENDAATEDRVLAAGKRADIVTLDWHLGSSAESARHLLARLSEPVGRRLRLVAIYTGDPDAARLAEDVVALGSVDRLDDFHFQRGPTRIVLLFKEGTARLGAPAERVTTAAGLPDRLIDAFTDMCSGLVVAATLSSLGAVREAMPEILGVLTPDLDPGYIGHRLAQARPDDASDHLADLIVSELRSIVDDDQARIDTAGRAAVQMWLDAQEDDVISIERDALTRLNIYGSGDDDVFDDLAADFNKVKERRDLYPTKYFVADDVAEQSDALLAERMAYESLDVVGFGDHPPVG